MVRVVTKQCCDLNKRSKKDNPSAPTMFKSTLAMLHELCFFGLVTIDKPAVTSSLLGHFCQGL
eukprot:4487173-Amphidinium_carterae.1